MALCAGDMDKSLIDNCFNAYWESIFPEIVVCSKSSVIQLHTHTHTHTCNPSQPRTVWHTVYTIRILHAIWVGTLWCKTCNRERFVYEYDSLLITGDVTGAHKFSSFFNEIYIRFATDCTNSRGGDRPRSECSVSHLRPRLEGITNAHAHTHHLVLMLVWLYRHSSSVYCVIMSVFFYSNQVLFHILALRLVQEYRDPSILTTGSHKLHNTVVYF